METAVSDIDLVSLASELFRATVMMLGYSGCVHAVSSKYPWA